MIFCSSCRWLRIQYSGVESRYIKIYSGKELYSGCKVCQHPDCFKHYFTIDPVSRKENKKRVAGQAQFNATNNCEKYDKYIWWRHW